MKPVILFDFDYTLYDSFAFIEGKIDFYSQNFALPRDFVKEKEQEAADEIITHYGQFIHEEYAKEVAHLLGIPDRWQEIFDVSLQATLHKNAVYPETEGVLKGLQENFRLGVFSQGDIGLQKTKLEKSGLVSFFDPELVLIYEEKIFQIPQIAQTYAVFCALDDRVEVVEAWSRAGIPLVIRVRRGVFAEGNVEEKRPNTYEVENLDEAYKIIESYGK